MYRQTWWHVDHFNIISRQYGHFVMSQMQMTKCFAHLIGPTMVSLLTSSDHDHDGIIIIAFEVKELLGHAIFVALRSWDAFINTFFFVVCEYVLANIGEFLIEKKY